MKIEKNIPRPKSLSGRFPKPLGPIAQILRSDDFEVGDSFLVPPVFEKSLQTTFKTSSKATGRKFSQRKTAEGVRVWRVA